MRSVSQYLYRSICMKKSVSQYLCRSICMKKSVSQCLCCSMFTMRSVSQYVYEICIVVQPIAFEVSLNLNLQLNPLDLFSKERGERDLED